MKRSAMEAAVRKLADRSMSCAELEQWLIRREYPEEEIRQVLESCLDYGYLNDARYCREYFRHAFRKNKAYRRAFAELKQKGVSEDTIRNAYEDYLHEEGSAEDEGTRAEREMEKILRAAGLSREDEIPEKIIARIGRKLHGYGYDPSLIYRLLGGLKRERQWTGRS